MNRVTASQPQAVAILRDKLEALYQADVQSSGQDMSPIQKEGVDLWVELMKAKEARNPRREQVGEREEKEALQDWSLVETHYSDTLQAATDMVDTLEASNISVRCVVVSLLRDRNRHWDRHVTQDLLDVTAEIKDADYFVVTLFGFLVVSLANINYFGLSHNIIPFVAFFSLLAQTVLSFRLACIAGDFVGHDGKICEWRSHEKGLPCLLRKERLRDASKERLCM